MKRQDRLAFEKWAKDIIAEYQKKLLITQHHIELVPNVDKGTSFMQMRFRIPYLDPELGYNPKMVAEYWPGKKHELEHGLVHELCHIITDHLYLCASERYISKQETERVRETLTDHIAMIILKNGV